MTGKKKFAVPTVDKVLTPHFGHCDQFAIIDTENDNIISVDFFTPPVHPIPKDALIFGDHVVEFSSRVRKLRYSLN